MTYTWNISYRYPKGGGDYTPRNQKIETDTIDIEKLTEIILKDYPPTPSPFSGQMPTSILATYYDGSRLDYRIIDITKEE